MNFLCDLVFVGYFLPYLYTCYVHSELIVGLDFHRQAKRAGSKLKSRIVAEQSIKKWSEIIEQMEDQVTAILREERFLMFLRMAVICLFVQFPIHSTVVNFDNVVGKREL